MMEKEEQVEETLSMRVLQRLRKEYPHDMKKVDMILRNVSLIDIDGTPRGDMFYDIRAIVLNYIPSAHDMFDEVRHQMIENPSQ